MVEQYYQELGRNLTSKQRNFVQYYIETGGSGPEAAMRAYNCSSRNSARVIAHRNLHNPGTSLVFFSCSIIFSIRSGTDKRV